MGSSKPTATRLRTVEVQGFQPKTLYRLSAPHGGHVLVISSPAMTILRSMVAAYASDENGRDDSAFIASVYDTEDHAAMLHRLGGYVIETESTHADEVQS